MSAIEDLRARIKMIEASGPRDRSVLPFGIAELDSRLPDGGLLLGALHEVADGSQDSIDGAAALFAGGIAARTKGQVLWCVTREDLFSPALRSVGLPPERVLYVEAGDDRSVLACIEEGVRHGGLGAVVGEIARLSMKSSRRLQLAAERSGTVVIALRRWRRPTDIFDFGQSNAAMTRWVVSSLPSLALPVRGIGRNRWRVELVRARAGTSGVFELEACNRTGHLGLPPSPIIQPTIVDFRRFRTAS